MKTWITKAVNDLEHMRLNYIDNIDCLEGMKDIPDGSVATRHTHPADCFQVTDVA